jgi:hypothetical protein
MHADFHLIQDCHCSEQKNTAKRSRNKLPLINHHKTGLDHNISIKYVRNTSSGVHFFSSTENISHICCDTIKTADCIPTYQKTTYVILTGKPP